MEKVKTEQARREEAYAEEDRLFEELKQALTGRVLTAEEKTGSWFQRHTISRVREGFAVGFYSIARRKHVTLCYREEGKEHDIASMYPEQAKKLLDNGAVELGGRWILKLFK